MTKNGRMKLKTCLHLPNERKSWWASLAKDGIAMVLICFLMKWRSSDGAIAVMNAPKRQNLMATPPKLEIMVGPANLNDES